MRGLGFGALALVLVAGQAGLALLAPGLATGEVHGFEQVVPFIAILAFPAALGFLAAPYLEQVRSSVAPVLVIAVTGALMRLVWFGVPPPLEDDYFRYLWEGAVVLHGFDPYRYSPEVALAGIDAPAALHALALQARHIVEHINFPDLTSIYPGWAQLAFALSHLISPWSSDGLRVILLLGDIATALALVALLRSLGRSTIWVALFWCNPLVTLMTAGTLHVDGLLAAPILGATLAAHHGRMTRAAAFLGLAAGIKVWPALLAPLILRSGFLELRRGWKSLVVFAVVAGLALAPLLLHALTSQSGLAAYAADWSNNNAPYAWVAALFDGLWGTEDELAVRLFRLLIGAAGVFVAIYLALRPIANLSDTLGRLLAISASLFYLAPAQFPWYALWFLPVAAALQHWPLMLPSVTLASYYLFFAYVAADDLDTFQHLVALVHAAPVWVWLVWRWMARRRALRQGFKLQRAKA